MGGKAGGGAWERGSNRTPPPHHRATPGPSLGLRSTYARVRTRAQNPDLAPPADPTTVEQDGGEVATTAAGFSPQNSQRERASEPPFPRGWGTCPASQACLLPRNCAAGRHTPMLEHCMLQRGTVHRAVQQMWVGKVGEGKRVTFCSMRSAGGLGALRSQKFAKTPSTPQPP